MKTLLIPLALLMMLPLAQAEEIKKWIDKDGKVHYGDRKAVIEDAVVVEELKPDDSFDPQEYEEAVKRNEQIEQQLEEYEKEDKEAERKEKIEKVVEGLSRPRAPAGGTTIVTPPVDVYTGPGRPIPLPGRPSTLPVPRPGRR